MAEKTADEKLDAIAAHLDSLHKRMDSADEERKADRARLDAACSSMEKADKARADAEEKAKKDAEEKEAKDCADKVRMDAEAKEKEEKEVKDKADKARADAEKEKEEKEAKDRADAAARTAAEKKLGDEAIARIAALEKRQTAELSDEDKPKFAAIQMRCDRAFQAWGKQAPPALLGESVKDYSVRLLNELKNHSKVYKGSNLSILAGDDAAFTVIQDAIINDAIEASNGSITVGAPLQKRVSKSETGHVLTKWVGDPAVAWAPFMGGATKFGRINISMANKH